MQRDSAADSNKVDDEIVRLKHELFRTKNALTDEIFKKRQLGSELSIAAEQKDVELRRLHRNNFDGLGGVLRSLYVFEARLRKEQQQIRRQLGERDAVIRQQQLEIAKLRLSLARYCNDGNDKKNNTDNAVSVNHDTDVNETPESSKPDLISSISPRSSEFQDGVDHPTPVFDQRSSLSDQGTRKNDSVTIQSPLLPSTTPVVDTSTRAVHNHPTNSNINFNRNVYHSKTVTDLSLNDISSFPNPTPNNNLFVVSNSIFSKNEFTHNEVSKETITSIKQNGKVITSALKKADKYPSPKTVHFGKTTHIPEPDEDGQTDIIKTVETLLLQCGDSCTESENDTSSTASTETSPSVSQMVRKFESICTTTNMSGDFKGSSSPTQQDTFNGSYIAEADLITAAVAEPDMGTDPEKSGLGNGMVSLSDLDPRNNFEEFRFEDSDLDREYRPEGDGLEYSSDQSAPIALSNVEDCAGQVNYESFLEVTGLSQKSIITVPIQPSNRNLYGSHRNVQKPKDVKSRNRAKSTSFECKLYPPAAIKYWTEPYL